MSDASATEGSAVSFAVSLSAASSQQVTVAYATSGGTATSGTDFSETSGTLTFAANETSKTVSVTTTDDSDDEADETFTLTLSSPTHATLEDATAIGTINDDDEPAITPTISVSDASATEGSAVSFTVSLSAASSQQVTVAYATSGGTATSGTDFSETSGTLTFAANETSKTVSVATTDDSDDEADETFTLTLSSPTHATLADATATGTINDDDEPATPMPVGEIPSQRVEVGATVSLDNLDSYFSDPDDEVLTYTAETSDGSVATVSVLGTTATISGVAAGNTRISIIATDPTKLYGRQSFSVTVLSPLTARFEDAATSHDGSSIFTVRVWFSEALASGGARGRVQRTLSTTGGTVQQVRRVDGRRDLFEVRIQPSGHSAVTVSLPSSASCDIQDALCTPAGQALSHPISVTVQGPPGLSVADAEVEEGPNAELAFMVTLDRAVSETVTVAWATSDGTATAGTDYTAASGTLTFAAGETEQTVSISVLDDTHDEESETLTLTLSTPSGAHLADATATGTIKNSDPLQRAWLSRFGRTVGTHVTDAVGDRLRATPGQGSHLTVGGYRLPLGRQAAGAAKVGRDALALGGSEPGEGEPPGSTDEDPGASGSTASAVLAEVVRVLGMGAGEAANGPGPDPRLGQGRMLDFGQTFNLRQVLLGSSFQLNLNGTEAGTARPRLTAWGRFAGTAFAGQDGDLALDGDVFTGTVGVDGEWDRLPVGVAVAHSRGDGGYTMPGTEERGTGDLETTLTSLHPYLRYAVTERLDVWGMVGYGWGESAWAVPEGTLKTDTDFVMGAFGGRGILLAPRESGGFQLATRTDAMLTRTTSEAVAGLESADAAAHRRRVILEGSRGVTWADGRRLTPTVEPGSAA